MSLNCLDSIDRPVPIQLSPLSLDAEPAHWWCFSMTRNVVFSCVYRGIKRGITGRRDVSFHSCALVISDAVGM